MEMNFRVKKSIVGSHIVDKDGKELEAVFPRGTDLKFINNTIIADFSKLGKEYRYKVLSYVEGRNISSFDCIQVDVLDNNNLKLTLRPDSEGVERGLIFDTETGKAASKIFDGMSDMQNDGTFISRLRVDRRRGKFDYIMKVDATGEVVSKVLNDYTSDLIDYEDLDADMNKTFHLMEERARANFIKGYSLEKIRK